MVQWFCFIIKHVIYKAPRAHSVNEVITLDGSAGLQNGGLTGGPQFEGHQDIYRLLNIRVGRRISSIKAWVSIP